MHLVRLTRMAGDDPRESVWINPEQVVSVFDVPGGLPQTVRVHLAGGHSHDVYGDLDEIVTTLTAPTPTDPLYDGPAGHARLIAEQGPVDDESDPFDDPGWYGNHDPDA